MSEIDKIYEAAHYDYIKRRDEIISKLNTIKTSDVSKETRNKWLDQTIEFIKEVQI